MVDEELALAEDSLSEEVLPATIEALVDEHTKRRYTFNR